MPTHVRIGHPKEANYDQSIDIWRKKQIGYLKSTGPREYPSHSRVWSFFEPIIKSHTTTSRQKYKTLPIRFTGSGNFTSLNKFSETSTFQISEFRGPKNTWCEPVFLEVILDEFFEILDFLFESLKEATNMADTGGVRHIAVVRGEIK